MILDTFAVTRPRNNLAGSHEHAACPYVSNNYSNCSTVHGSDVFCNGTNTRSKRIVNFFERRGIENGGATGGRGCLGHGTADNG